ncbi:MAG: hypothetical protein JXP34_13600 [Planctomycetes bacterium]|nr:hypothetical protein [Planctomycetota bacterium]
MKSDRLPAGVKRRLQGSSAPRERRIHRSSPGGLLGHPSATRRATGERAARGLRFHPVSRGGDLDRKAPALPRGPRMGRGRETSAISREEDRAMKVLTCCVLAKRWPLVAAALVMLFLAGGMAAGPAHADEVAFIRGDANSDGKVSISDALTIRRYLFNGAWRPACGDAADADDNGRLEITDQIMILGALFLGRSPLPPPTWEPGPDPTPETGAGCAPYEVFPPGASEDLVRIGDIEGAPGEAVEIPVYLTNLEEVEAYQLVLRYDPEALTLRMGPTGDALSFEATFYEGPNLDSTRYYSVNAGPEPDILLVSLIPSFTKLGFETPPGFDRLVFKIRATISPDVEPGTEILLEPWDGPDGEGVGPYRIRNELTSRGDARYVSFFPRTGPGILRIIPDITIFRGDSNSDGEVEMADASYTLNWLFLGGTAPRCPDEADTNDDGRIDVSDPIAILATLFLGASNIAPPYPEIGYDTTPDDLPPCESD